MLVQRAIGIEFVRTKRTSKGAVIFGPMRRQLRRGATFVIAEDTFESFDVRIMSAADMLAVMWHPTECGSATGRLTNPWTVVTVNGLLMPLESVFGIEVDDAASRTGHVVSRHPLVGRILHI